MENLGEKIKQIRLSRGLTQQDIANELGVARNTVSQWENNERKLSAEQLIRFAQIVKIPLDFFDDKPDAEQFFSLMQNLAIFFNSEGISAADKDAAYQDIMRLYLKTKEVCRKLHEDNTENDTQKNIPNIRGKQ